MSEFEIYVLSAILVMAFATFISRAIPFLFLGKLEHNPHLNFIGHSLPPAVMVILVFYCLKDVAWTAPYYGRAEIFSVILVAAIQMWRRNALLSIVLGTGAYLALVSTSI